MKSNFRDYPGKSGRVGRSASITPVLLGFADFFSISLVFSMVLTLALVEVKLNGI